MKDKKSRENRRKLLKSIAAGSGAIVAGKSLPETWSRPVVDSVMLPAHAQTSPTSPTETRIYSDTGGIGENTYGEDNTLLAEAFDMLVPTANAGKGGPSDFYICISILLSSVGGIASVVWKSPNGNSYRRGDITLDSDLRGQGTITARYPDDISSDQDCLDLFEECGDECLTRPCRIDASNPDVARFEIQNREGGWPGIDVGRSESCGPEPVLNGNCPGGNGGPV